MGASICPSCDDDGSDEKKTPPKYMGRHVMHVFGVTAPRLYALLQQKELPNDHDQYAILINTLQVLQQAEWLEKVVLSIEDVETVALTYHADQRDHVIFVRDNYIVAREETRRTGSQLVGCISKWIGECDVLVKLPEWIEDQKNRPVLNTTESC